MNHPVWLAASALVLLWTTAQAGELPTAKPEAVGLSAEKLAKVAPALQKLVDDGKIAGGVALVARHGKVAYVAPFGFRDLEARTPMTADSIFAIASMSKPITCVAAMGLVERGKLSLDDPVAKYLPELKDLRVLGDPKDDTESELGTVPAKRPITVRDLFAHTSGFAYAGMGGNDRLTKSYSRAGATAAGHKTIADEVKYLGRVVLAHQPGEGWTYGPSHDVLGRVIEVVSGQNFDRYLREQIFTPLDMPDTSFLVPEAKRERVATTYRAGEGGKLVALPKRYGSATYFSGGGGLFSTARDYTRFAQMLLNGGELDGTRILNPESIAAMTTNAIGEHTAFGFLKYGLGFGLMMAPAPAPSPSPGAAAGKPVLDRYFWGGLYSTNFWIVPRRDLIEVIMVQVLPTNHGGAERVFVSAVEGAIEP